MELSNHGIKLVRLTRSEIELVRLWRNSEEINQYMFFNDYITEEMQERWFQSINDENNYYFIIEANGGKIGLCNLKDIDHDKGSCEAGLFIYEKEYLNKYSNVSFKCVKIMNDFAFVELNLNTIYIKIKKSNSRAIRFNEFIGYEYLTESPAGALHYELTKGNYLRELPKILKIISRGEY